MNCKQGDLAVIVKSYAGNEGKVVCCICFKPNYKFGDVNSGRIDFIADAWEIDRELSGLYGLSASVIADFQLRPLRDNDGEDESLTWAGKPETVQS